MPDDFNGAFADADETSFTHAMRLAAHIARCFAGITATSHVTGADALRAFADVIENGDHDQFSRMLDEERPKFLS